MYIWEAYAAANAASGAVASSSDTNFAGKEVMALG